MPPPHLVVDHQVHCTPDIKALEPRQRERLLDAALSWEEERTGIWSMNEQTKRALQAIYIKQSKDAINLSSAREMHIPSIHIHTHKPDHSWPRPRGFGDTASPPPRPCASRGSYLVVGSVVVF